MNKRLLSICKRKLDMDKTQVQSVLEGNPEAKLIIGALIDDLSKCSSALGSVQSQLIGARSMIKKERGLAAEYLAQLQINQIAQSVNDGDGDPNTGS